MKKITICPQEKYQNLPKYIKTRALLQITYPIFGSKENADKRLPLTIV